MRHTYPQEIAMFRCDSRPVPIECAPVEGKERVFLDELGAEHGVTCLEPVTIAAVLMYEAHGGTLADAMEVASSRRGRKPDALFARAHAYQLRCTEMGRGC